MAANPIRPITVEQVQEAVPRHGGEALDRREGVALRGGGSKPALAALQDGVTLIALSALSGVLEYDPAEFTITALAGTRLADVAPLLEGQGQYLPFDPPLAAHGATLGGTVAAGLSGPGRYRSGGLRDFILGVRYVDGEGNVIRAGSKVVKNSAGFDIPKAMVGSLGSLGALVEVTFKVLPRPEAYASLMLECASLGDALQVLVRLTRSQLDIQALDLEPVAAGARLWIRLGGLAKALPGRLERLRGLAGGGEIVDAQVESAFWRDACEFAWAPRDALLVKVPLTPKRIPGLEAVLSGAGPQGLASPRRYSVGGQVAWIAWPGTREALESVLAPLGLSGLVIFGPPGRARLGPRPAEAFERRVKAALDPTGRFAEV